jgi:NAD(P)-dependent dehydrogenase (short-subunit alcohol dehydrogenase family)
MLDLTGKTALVTGGSRGIGATVALTLAKQGCDLHIHYSSSPVEAQKVADSVIALGRKADIIKSDLSSKACATEIMNAVKTSEFGNGKLDIIVLNGAINDNLPLADINETNIDSHYGYVASHLPPKLKSNSTSRATN